MGMEDVVTVADLFSVQLVTVLLDPGDGASA